LRAAGGKIIDLNVIAIILDGLLSSFVDFCTTWDNRPDVDQALDKLYNALMNANERLQKHDDNVMALTASKPSKSKRFEAKGSRSNSKVNGKPKIRFSGKCQKPGHKKADCFLLKNTETKVRQKDETQGTISM